MATRYSGPAAEAVRGGQARSLSTASADFDEDGMPDLVSGFATAGGGAITVHRGNVDALWPYGPLRGTEPPAFLSDARVFSVPEAPDFLAAGDFDADGHWDIVAARAGGSVLYLMKGDGHGGFTDAERIGLPGGITAMTSGEINRTDGLTDLMVAVKARSGAQVLVFESPAGALRGAPEAFDLPAEAASLALIPLDGGLMNGLAVAAGHDLLLIHGRDRLLTRSKADRDSVPVATVTRQSLPFAMRSLAAGRFSSHALDLAAIGDDGQIHILERSDANEPIGAYEMGISLGPGSGMAVRSTRERAIRPIGPMPKTAAMILRSAIRLPVSLQTGASGAKLVTARVAGTGRDSLVVVDPVGGRLHIVSHSSRETATMTVSASLDVAGGAPAAVQPMRINRDSRTDLVVLPSHQAEPIVFHTSADYVFVVTNTSDSADGSLRSWLDSAALLGANGYSTEIDFNIPVSDPNRDPVTGVFTIQPVGQNVLLALPNLSSNTIVDGYTQPGATPNNLTMGDNAHPLIEINGSMAGSGPSAFQVFGTGNVIRGFVLTNFTGAVDQNDPRYLDGCGGADIEGESNFFEGNFVGIDAGGTFAKTDNIGIFVGGGLATEFGNTIGGTTPQARNIISGNRFGGIRAAKRAYPNTSSSREITSEQIRQAPMPCPMATRECGCWATTTSLAVPRPEPAT